MIKSKSATRWTILTAALLLLAILAPGALAEETKEEPVAVNEDFSATAMSLGGPRTGATRLNIRIRRWSTEEERAGLLNSINTSRNPTELHAELNRQESTGNIQVVGRLAYDFRYARQTIKDGRRIIILATDRPLFFEEITNATRSREFNTGLVRLDLDAETNEGTGELSVGTRIFFDESRDQIVVETGGTQTVNLTRVQPR